MSLRVWPVNIVSGLVLAFLILSSVMFWLSFFHLVKHEAGSKYGYEPGYDYGFQPGYDYYYPATNEQKKLAPYEERESIDKITADLKKKSNSELRHIQALADGCLN